MTVPVLDPISVTDSVSEPDVSQLTTKSLDGTGVFDVLMKTVKMHLLEEYENDRITGVQYSEVYLGAVGAVLQQSVTYLLNHQNEKRVRAEIGLIRQQTVTELANTDNDIPQGLGFNGTEAVEGMVKAQLDKLAKDIELADNQIAVSAIEKDLMGQRVITELAQTGASLTQAQAAGLGFNTVTSIEGVIQSTLDREQMEKDLIEQKLVTEVGQTSDTKPSALGVIDGTAITGVMKSVVDKAAAEKVLLAQKTITELAQSSDTVSITTDALNTGSTVAGTIGKQKVLFTAQSDGFARDAEQKLAKMMLETWAVDATVGDAEATHVNLLNASNIGGVMAKAMNGIDVTPDATPPA